MCEDIAIEPGGFRDHQSNRARRIRRGMRRTDAQNR